MHYTTQSEVSQALLREVSKSNVAHVSIFTGKWLFSSFGEEFTTPSTPTTCLNPLLHSVIYKGRLS